MIQILLSLLVSLVHAESSFQCSATYDELNIPHIKTSSIEEFYYCFGLHHGKDRAWEMDYFRRTAQGRNAEVLGFSQLKSDLMMRVLDLPGKADKIWRDFPEDKRKLLEHYAEGVNKGFERGKLSKEFQDADFSPEPWIPQHTLAVLLLQSFDQTRKTFTRDYDEEIMKENFGAKAEVLFNDDGMPWENNILKDGEYETKTSETKVTYTKSRPIKLWGNFPKLSEYESGSNNWAVSKSKSKTGNAIFANDPHLDLKTPLFWYWISLKTPEHSLIGGSLPGVPLVITGTNGKVAWGLTNSYINTADLSFIHDLKDEQIETFRPVVYVKFGFLKLPFFFKSFEKLKTGHAILPLALKTEGKLALRWTGFSLKAQEILPMFDLFKVKDVSETDVILAGVGIPSWNFVFADNNGDIGYRLVGKVYKETKKTPFGSPSLSFNEFTQESYLGKDERPFVLKPKRGYVYSANNRHWPSNAKFYGGRAYSHSFRGYRIDEMLQSKQDIESFKNIQCDRQVVDAKFFLPKLKKYLKLSELENWDMIAKPSSKALPVYRRLMDISMEKWKVNEYALFKKLDNLSDKEIKDIHSFYALAVSDTKGKTWGEILKVSFPHMSKNSEWNFSPEMSGHGDVHSVDPGTSKWNESKGIYEHTSGASMRMIVELTKKNPIIYLTLPGLNRDYDSTKDNSPWLNWSNCQYVQVKL